MPKCYSILFIIIIIAQGCYTAKRKVTKEEAIAFAHSLEQEVATRNPHAFDQVFDEDAFVKRVMEAGNGKLAGKDREAIVTSLRQSKIGEQVVEAARSGTYELVKVYEKNDTQHVLFRLYGASGINYHDLLLVHAGKDVKVADMYIYYSSENFSKTVADILLQLLNYSDLNAEMINTIKEMKKSQVNEEYETALSYYNQLPDTLKKSKSFQLVHLIITSKINDSDYETALDEFSSLYPHEPGMNLQAIDIHITHKQYDKAANDVDSLDSFINKDPFLDYYRGLIYKLQKDTAKMMTCLKNLYRNFPTFGEGIIELMAAYAREGDVAKAKKLVAVYRSNTKLNQKRLDLVLTAYPQVNN